jgi:predicted nucleotidyltransferase
MFQRLLQQLATALDARSIEYMLIGGQAVLVYGEPRLTKDIDVTLGIGPDRLNDILAMIKELCWKVLVEQPEAFVRSTLVLPCRDPETGIRIDLIFSFSPYERQALQRVNRVKVGGVDVRYASLEDVIIHKLVAGRPRDIEDVRMLLLKNSKVDRDYLDVWLTQFQEALDVPLLQRLEDLLRATQ